MNWIRRIPMTTTLAAVLLAGCSDNSSLHGQKRPPAKIQPNGGQSVEGAFSAPKETNTYPLGASKNQPVNMLWGDDNLAPSVFKCQNSLFEEININKPNDRSIRLQVKSQVIAKQSTEQIPNRSDNPEKFMNINCNPDRSHPLRNGTPTVAPTDLKTEVVPVGTAKTFTVFFMKEQTEAAPLTVFCLDRELMGKADEVLNPTDGVGPDLVVATQSKMLLMTKPKNTTPATYVAVTCDSDPNKPPGSSSLPKPTGIQPASKAVPPPDLKDQL